ncbi:MAG TPA: hypothetical protein DIT07_01295 [Sphingobacteriaceae bacterium]|nr:hypothetical protein [Sphingobacteriaceae bacterium]
MNRLVKHILSVLSQKEKKLLAFQVLLNILISIFDIAFIGLILFVIHVYTSGEIIRNTYLPDYLADHNSLLLISISFILFSIKNYAGYLISKSQYHFVYQVASRISGNNLLNYLEGDYSSYVHTDSSVNIRKISQEPIEFSHYVLTGLQQLITQGILIIFTLAAILIYNTTLFLLLFILLFPPVILVAAIIRKKLKSAKINAKTTSEKNMQFLQESLSAYIESNIYDKNEFFKNRYHRYQVQLNKYLSAQQIIQGLPARLVEIFAVMGFFILILLNRFSEGSSTISILTIGVFMGASYKIIPGIVKILNSIGQMRAYEFTVDDLLTEKRKTSVISNQIDPPHLTSIEFTQVGFDFKKHKLFKPVNFKITQGDFIGIAGASGKGKTTLINLLLGFLEPTDGDIAINGKEENKWGRQRYWKRISYLKQQPFFIHDTVLKNIILSDNSYDASRLDQAISISGSESLISQLPDGLNELIRENGKNLSGGQRQRIMLARALYKDFDLLILDESFSEMDEKSENVILNQLKELSKKGKMILFITHNSSSLSFCDEIISLDEG